MGFSHIISKLSERISRFSEQGLRTPFHFRADLLGTPTLNWVLQNHLLQVLLSPAGCRPKGLLHKRPQNAEADLKGKTQNKSTQQGKQEGLWSALTKAKDNIPVHFQGMPLTQTRSMNRAHFVAHLPKLSKICTCTLVQYGVLESTLASPYWTLLNLGPKYHSGGYISYNR